MEEPLQQPAASAELRLIWEVVRHPGLREPTAVDLANLFDVNVHQAQSVLDGRSVSPEVIAKMPVTFEITRLLALVLWRRGGQKS
eukprot:1799344-Amphidinium_carterae.2